MKRKTQQFIGAFLITAILIAALCGFVLVDLSTDRYMPGAFAPLFQVSSVNEEGIAFAALGERYQIDAQGLEPSFQNIWEWRGIMPPGITLVGNAVTRALQEWQRNREASKPIEEPW